MIEFMSSWVKGLGLAIVIVSILEMLLPNNKIKKYIRVVMGVYILFTIISPFLSNEDLIDINNINFEEYTTTQTSTNLDQTSMDNRIKELYIEELEKDITKKLKEKGYDVTYCKVKADITDNQEDTGITKIKIKVQKLEEQQQDNENNVSLENEIVTQIQKIKPIDTTIIHDEDNEKIEEKEDNKINKSDIQNLKKFLIEEYEVSEKCLEIN